MKHLLAVWPDVLEQIKKSKRVLLLSDFDGTLTPIVEKPELAAISEDMRQLLHSLAKQKNITVGIISGRALADLKEKVNLRGIVYAGNHGYEIEGPGLNFISPIAEEMKPFFRVIRQVLNLTLGSIKGILIEDKGLSLSVHYRQVENHQVGDVADLVERAVNVPIVRGIFQVTSGKKVYEVRPVANWDKGKAIRLLMKRFGKGGRNSGLLPIYLGDDLTDEDGFRMIEKYGNGVAVHVGGCQSNSIANYYLRSPDEVYEFVFQLMQCAEEDSLWEQYSTVS